MKKTYLIVFVCGIILLLSIKVNTYIYIGDYSWNTRYGFDVKIKIDDKEILNDSLTNSFPYSTNFVVKERLRYGLHKISIFSDRANINQENIIFLLPNQFVSVEFFPADTLTFLQYDFPDSVIELYKLPSRSYNPIFQDTLDFPIFVEKSRFGIRTGFNPFRLE